MALITNNLKLVFSYISKKYIIHYALIFFDINKKEISSEHSMGEGAKLVYFFLRVRNYSKYLFLVFVCL